MKLNIDYPPTITGNTSTDIVQLRAWCAILLEELNLSVGAINGGASLSSGEKLVNWK